MTITATSVEEFQKIKTDIRNTFPENIVKDFDNAELGFNDEIIINMKKKSDYELILDKNCKLIRYSKNDDINNIYMKNKNSLFSIRIKADKFSLSCSDSEYNV